MYGENRFPDVYVPTVSDTYRNQCDYEGREVHLAIWDTAGQDEFRPMRVLSYNDTSCFIICFSLTNPQSLENACKKWLNEAKVCGPVKCPKILVGLKRDLRDYMEKEGQKEEIVSEK